MRQITWEVEFLALPLVVRHCQKCGGKARFVCSEKFRINAQQKALDVWLIYTCMKCAATWNARVYAHIAPQSLAVGRLAGFQANSPALVAEYAMDRAFLGRNGAVEIVTPPYRIVGEAFWPEERVTLYIKSRYAFPLKVSALLREGLQLSQGAFRRLVEDGYIKGMQGQDLRKCRLQDSITLLIEPWQGIVA